MAGEWEEARLGELCDLRAGSVFKPALQGQTSGEFPFVKVSDMNLPANAVRIQDANNWVSAADLKELRAKPFPPGTVVFAKIGEALRQNRLRQVARETVVDNNMMGAVPRINRIDPRFFYYALSRIDFSDIAQGTALPYLTVSSLSALTIDLPPPPEQCAIAHILGTLDDKIELNRRRNQTLEAMARALFKDWFVDFGPVRAKLKGREPYLPADLWQLFPDRLDDEGKPEGWEVKKIGDVIERLGVGKKYDQKTVEQAGKVPVLDQGKSGVIGFHNDEPGVMASEKDPVVVFANHTCYMRLINFPFSAIQNVLPFKGRGVPTVWAYFATLGKQKFNEYKGHWPDFVIHDLCVPGPFLCEKYANIVQPILEKLWVNERESQALTELRDTLLPKLISGELRIKDVEKFIERMGI